VYFHTSNVISMFHAIQS